MIAEIIRRTIAVDVLANDGQMLAVAVEIVIPAQVAAPAVAFFCTPGTGLNKTYYHLEVDSDINFSFARHMAARGCITIALDLLGTGESSRPVDGFALTPETMIAANRQVVDVITAELRAGRLSDALPPLPALHCVGVGHSMGGLLTVMLQAHYHCFDAIVVMGFDAQGRPEHLSDDERPYANDAQGMRENIVRLARLRFAEPYFEVNTQGQAAAMYGGRADRAALRALKGAAEKFLTVMSYFTMMPGNIAPECAMVKVPVLLAVGDSDITRSAHAIPALFPQSFDVTLLVLPDTGHTHFAFPSCTKLFERIADWSGNLTKNLAD